MPRKWKTAADMAALLDPSTEGWDDGLYWDSDYLHLQVRGSTRSWLMRWTLPDGRVATMGLGSGFKVAQREVRLLRDKYMALVREGIDPRRARDEERAAAGLKPVRSTAVATISLTAMTFRDAARAYMAKHEDGWKDPNHALQWSQSLRDYAYPLIGDVPVTQVSVDHVVQALEPIWRSKTVTAKKVKSRIALVLDYAEAMEWRSGGNPARSKTVTIRLGSGGKRVVQHFRAIHYPQMPAFWKALTGVDSTAADVVRFMILSAVRPSEALGARWEEIDLEHRVWTVPGVRMKMGHEHRVPLSDEAVAILERRTAQAEDDVTTGLVFPGNNKRGMLNRAVPRTLIQRLGFNATAHGCRSSFADWTREVAKADREVRELALAHREQNAAVAAYSRSDLLEDRRVLMQRWADFLTGRSICTAE